MADDRERRSDVLLAPTFISALLLLALNDQILKPAFENGLTGKLSDFAGLFVLTALVAAVAPAARSAAAAAIVAFFVLWKSPFSEPFIATWNALLPWPVTRTVDVTDLVAVVVVPLGVAYVGRKEVPPLRVMWRSPLRLTVAALAVVCFAATSYQSRVDYNVSYSFSGPSGDLMQALEKRNIRVIQDRGNEYTLSIPSDFCLPAVDAHVEIDGTKGLLQLRRMSYRCRAKWHDEEILLTIFDSVVAAPVQLTRLGDGAVR